MVGRKIRKYLYIDLYLNFISGNINENLSFQYAYGSKPMNGCGATLNGEFWYFGYRKEVSFLSIDLITIVHEIFFSIEVEKSCWLSIGKTS